ncbi:DUF58 domain-containing protein [Pseudomonas akapageensis]|uniref:DUF58 domain-containing protein n=1 Tax=Pseudomonas akapageensis TaxID=2609961 RepID=UPI00140A9AD0|nr:DUF58 domain-containing protein [Pseudomonas akapageensis]
MKPSRLLILWIAALLALAIALGGLKALDMPLPASSDAIAWGLLLALALLALLDAVLLVRLPSPQLQRQLPGSLALGRTSEVRIDVHHPYKRPLRLSFFDHVPDGLGFEHLPQSIDLEPGQDCQLGYRLRPLRRGAFTFARSEISLPSPLGLWVARRYLVLADTTRVYPDFARLYNAQLLAVDNWLNQLGVRQQPRRGQGLEFHQLREFREGDSLRQIDWKATARQRVPIAREYQEERDQQIMFLIDCGRRMRSQDGELSHFDHALNACLLLSYIALRQGDAVGLATFASDQPRYLAPAKGQSQLKALLNAVHDLDSCPRAADFNAAASQVLMRQKRRALVILVTNLRDDDDDELLSAARRIGRQHRLLIASLREEVLDSLRQAPVQTAQEALAYCGAIDYLNARDALHERLEAQGIAVLDSRATELEGGLVSRYLGWKKAATL